MDSFNAYQQETADTAIYPQAGTGSALALAYVGLGLGEAGEVQGKLKKIIRDNNAVMTPLARDGILDELGDVLWYVARTAAELDCDLADVAQRNLDKLTSRAQRGTLQGSGDLR